MSSLAVDPSFVDFKQEHARLVEQYEYRLTVINGFGNLPMKKRTKTEIREEMQTLASSIAQQALKEGESWLKRGQDQARRLDSIQWYFDEKVKQHKQLQDAKDAEIAGLKAKIGSYQAFEARLVEAERADKEAIQSQTESQLRLFTNLQEFRRQVERLQTAMETEKTDNVQSTNPYIN